MLPLWAIFLVGCKEDTPQILPKGEAISVLERLITAETPTRSYQEFLEITGLKENSEGRSLELNTGNSNNELAPIVNVQILDDRIEYKMIAFTQIPFSNLRTETVEATSLLNLTDSFTHVPFYMGSKTNYGNKLDEIALIYTVSFNINDIEGVDLNEIDFKYQSTYDGSELNHHVPALKSDSLIVRCANGIRCINYSVLPSAVNRDAIRIYFDYDEVREKNLSLKDAAVEKIKNEYQASVLSKPFVDKKASSGFIFVTQASKKLDAVWSAIYSLQSEEARVFD
jgi:hypothetical protein